MLTIAQITALKGEFIYTLITCIATVATVYYLMKESREKATKEKLEIQLQIQKNTIEIESIKLELEALKTKSAEVEKEIHLTFEALRKSFDSSFHACQVDSKNERREIAKTLSELSQSITEVKTTINMHMNEKR